MTKQREIVVVGRIHRATSADRTEITAAYTEGLSEPVTFVEWGSFVGAAWSLFAARGVLGVEAVASFDPLVIGVAGDGEAAELDGIFERFGALADQGRLEDAALRFPREMAEHGFYTEVHMAGGAATDL